MIFKAKTTSRGTLDKLKARCCARGDLIEDPIGQDNWSSCVSQRTVRLFIAQEIKVDRRPKQLYFIGEYLQARMRARHFIKLQPELAPYYPELNKYFYKPLLLNKTTYGLTVSAKYWNEELISWLTNNEFGCFQQSTADQSLFCYRNSKGKWLHFIFYVDYGLYYGDSESTELEFLTHLKNNFHVEDKGYAHWFLGMRIHAYEDGSITLDQNKFVNTIIKKFCPNDAPWGVPKYR